MTISLAFLAPATGAMRGGIPFGRGALYYVLRNHFYIGEVEYKDEILPGEQPPIMDRALFDARAPARNGIFGCRDRGPKIAQQRPKFEK